MIRIDQNTCRDLDQARKLEWLETNGLGGFSSSSIVGLNTRRYHGLLTAATKPPVGRMVLLSKIEETLLIDGRRLRFLGQPVSRRGTSARAPLSQGVPARSVPDLRLSTLRASKSRSASSWFTARTRR